MMQGCGTKKREKEEEEKKKALPREASSTRLCTFFSLDKSSLLCNIYNAYRINNITIMVNTESSITSIHYSSFKASTDFEN